MNFYIDIGIVFKGKKYIAKLYGDRIICTECGVDIHRSEIYNYKLKLFKRKILLTGEKISILTDFHKVIAHWFDPLYEIRFAFVGFSVILPVAFGLYFFGIKSMFPAVLISMANAVLITWFFRKIRKSKDTFYPGVILLVLGICLPVVYWYPYSGYIFVTGLIIAPVITVAGFVFRNAFNAKKYYLSLAWMMLSIFYYFWLVSIFKIWADIKLQDKVKETFAISQTSPQFTFIDKIWEKPPDWQIKPYRLRNIMVKRKSALWQFSPLPILYEIKTYTYPEFGWITVMDVFPGEIMRLISHYIEKANRIFLLELVDTSNERIVFIGGRKSILKSYRYYDMVLRKPIEIHVLAVPLLQEEAGQKKAGSVIFAIALPPEASLNYHLELINSGFLKQ